MPDSPQDVGRRLANIPLTQFSLLSKYQLTDQLAVGGTAIYGGEVYAGHLAANVSYNHTVDWWRFDAFAENELPRTSSSSCIGLNLTDELYYDAIYQAPGLANPERTFAFVAPGARRLRYREVEIRLDRRPPAPVLLTYGPSRDRRLYSKRRACRSRSRRY